MNFQRKFWKNAGNAKSRGRLFMWKLKELKTLGKEQNPTG